MYVPSSKEEGYIRIAIKNARRSNFGRSNHGAVLTKGGSIISTGYNTIKNSPWLPRTFPGTLKSSMHAEMNCLCGFSANELKGASLYVVRASSKNDKLYNSMPCLLCTHMLSLMPLRKVIYSTELGFEEL